MGIILFLSIFTICDGFSNNTKEMLSNEILLPLEGK